jgi:probable phosphoglycerate mutase
MTTVVLLRHGQTEWNRTRRIQGWAASSLNERGREQARVAGQYLADAYDFDRVVASDLRRTRETTAELRGQGRFPEPEFTGGWRERSFGELQGLEYEQVFGEFPEFDATATGAMALDATPDRGESMVDTYERVIAAYDGLLTEHGPDDTVLVVTHGGPIYVALAYARGQTLPEAFGAPHQENCAVNELTHDHAADETTVVTENDTSYRDDDAIEERLDLAGTAD